jgi:hypothetical protein
MPAQMGAPVPAGRVLPSGGVLYGPYLRPPLLVRFWWLPAALFLVAAMLILINGAALLSPVFFAAWVGIFPWIGPIGFFGFILGAILGLIILGGLVLFFLGFRVLAAFLVFPAAIASLFIGGGFLAGVMVGVLASLLIVFTQRLHP